MELPWAIASGKWSHHLKGGQMLFRRRVFKALPFVSPERLVGCCELLGERLIIVISSLNLRRPCLYSSGLTVASQAFSSATKVSFGFSSELIWQDSEE